MVLHYLNLLTQHNYETFYDGRLDLDRHSKPLKTIRFEQDHFPTEKECWHWFTKDEDVEIYMKSDICVKFNNVHEYHK